MTHGDSLGSQANSIVDPLVELGFTSLEAEIYGLLLEEPGSTGYRLAQRLRKPAPNIYKAIESLQSKGAVMVVDGKHRHCTAVPPDELLGHLERRFQSSRKLAARALAERTTPPTDDRLYQLGSPSAVFEKARTMLRRADNVVLFDGFPGAVRELTADLVAVSERNVPVGALVYEPVPAFDETNIDVVINPRHELIVERWPGQWLLVTVDASELLLAFLTPDLSAVHQAVWSRSPYLVWTLHGGSWSELILGAIEDLLATDGDLDEIRQVIARLNALKDCSLETYQQMRKTLESKAVSRS